jgi:uncharacterized protein (TIGR00255 family)
LLLSMTGFGEARREQGPAAVSVELKAINSRYLKLYIRATEGYGSLEPRIESLIRSKIRRGTVQVNVRVDRAASPEDYRINAGVLSGYRRQLEAIGREWSLPVTPSLESLLLLPGVVSDHAAGSLDPAADWPMIRDALEAAIDNLDRMRSEEGQAMAADLAANCRLLGTGLDAVEERAPVVVEAYRSRLEERLNNILAQIDVTLSPADVLKEVGLFADRADVSEEITRLRSHLDQFATIMGEPESSGRKLEFLTQEMVREVNTIGSKASDAEISRHVVEMKTAVERIREMIQNVE